MKFIVAIICLAAVAQAAKYAGPPEGLAWGMESLTQGWGPENVVQRSGYIAVSKTVDNGGHIFFWMFESRNDPVNDPVVMWLTGGPGCSSELAIFYEQGPYRIDSNQIVTRNDFAWNSNATVIFIDQPVGTGFSYAESDADYVKTEDQVAEDMYEFLQTFFTQFPQYGKQSFFVTGESYAGHYVPAISSRIFKGNQAKEGVNINLQGLAIGNGLVNPAPQYTQYAPYAYDNKIITESQYASINGTVNLCESLIASQSSLALLICNGIVSSIQSDGNNFNVYDIRLPCIGSLCYDFSPLDKLMAESSVQTSLGVSSQASWSECNTQVHSYLTDDWMTNCETYLPPLLEAGIKVLVYSGKEDFICNWYGGRLWVEQMPWTGQTAYNGESYADWTVDGTKAGTLKQYKNLAFLGVDLAGHMVPMDQPKNALEMLNRWVRDQPFSN